MATLIDILAAELERPRQLSRQVSDHIVGTYSIELEAIGRFLAEDLPRLEDYEHDLVLSPLFTPKLADQAVVAEFLVETPVPKDQWPALIEQLKARPTTARLVTSDGQAHPVILRDVLLERYVHRLRLDAAIPESLARLVKQASLGDRAMLLAIARRAAWGTDGRREILERFLKAASADAGRIVDAAELLNLVESYRPADTPDLLARIPAWIQIVEQEIRTGSGPKPFLSAHIHESHGGDRDQRRQDNSFIASKETELALLQRLQQMLLLPAGGSGIR